MIDKSKLPAQSLILLKHATRRDAVPTPEDLEIGEVALSLFPGQEALWVKNGNGEIKDIRKPNPEGLWGDCFVTYPTRSEFDRAFKFGEVDYNSVCFITLEKQIWAKGDFYATTLDPSELDEIVSTRFISIPTTVYNLDPKTSSSEDIELAWGGKEKFLEMVLSVNNNSVVAAIDTGSGTIPVGINTDIRSEKHIKLVLQWIWEEKYITKVFIYKDDIFGISKYDESDLNNSTKLKEIDDRLDRVEENLSWYEA